MPPRKQSQLCEAPNCTRLVRFDYDGFPYCKDHGHLKGTTNNRITGEDSPFTIQEQRELLRNPERTTTRQAMMDVSVLTSTLGSSSRSRALAVPVYAAWRKATARLDMTNPDVCAENLDMLLEIGQKAITRVAGYTTDIARCEGGRMFAKNGGIHSINDHRVIVAHDDDRDVRSIVDVACAAPMAGKAKALKEYESGQSTLTDGMSIMPIIEYALYSSTSYDTFTSESTGEVIWDNVERFADNSNNQRVRDLLNAHPDMQRALKLRAEMRRRGQYTDHHVAIAQKRWDAAQKRVENQDPDIVDGVDWNDIQRAAE